MNISKTHFNRCELVKISGKIDHSNYLTLENYLNNLIDAGSYNIILDMEDINYMSSAGIRVLTGIRSACKRHRGNLALVNVQERIHEVIELAALTKLFTFYEDAVEAVGSV
jgi:anti-sigma B factor antagonist